MDVKKIVFKLQGKRAQAAIEFLATYGWAVLIIALVLVALGWLGVFNPQGAIQQRCSFPIGTLECNDVLVVKTNQGPGSTLKATILEVTNNFNKDVYICGLQCSDQPVDPAVGAPSDPLLSACGEAGGMMFPADRRIRAGEKRDLARMSIPPPFLEMPTCLDKTGNSEFYQVGNTYSGKLYIFYSYTDDTGSPRVISGTLVTKVEAP